MSALYRSTKKTTGSENVNVKALPRTTRWSFTMTCMESICDSLFSLESPVAFLILCALLYKMLAEFVSGTRKKSTINTTAHSHVSSQIVQRRPFAWEAKPPTSGPNTGPSTPEAPKMPIQYASSTGGYMFVIVAPPVARTGPPKNPNRNRKTRSIVIFTAYPVGSCSSTKIKSVQK